jgi:NTE family protein
MYSLLNPMTRFFGIFEGGGVKGFAHIGALKALEEKRVQLVGVAGTSAGAIIASLTAVGYSPDELFNPYIDNKGIFNAELVRLFASSSEYENFVKMVKDANSLPMNNLLKFYLYIPYFCFRNRKILSKLIYKKGIFKTDDFIEWLDSLLEEKLNQTALKMGLRSFSRPIEFNHLNIVRRAQSHKGVSPILPSLKIIATDISNRKLQVYCADSENALRVENRTSIARAVAASISIPLFFQPTCNNQSDCVDGGLLSNFPAWVFDKERIEFNQLISTFAFKLVERSQRINGNEIFYNYLKGLLETTISGDEDIHTRRIEGLHIIRVPVATSSFNFGVKSSTKKELYDTGKNSTLQYIEQHEDAPLKFSQIANLLEFSHSYIRSIIPVENLIGNLDDFNIEKIHLRVCLILPNASLNQLRVSFSFNMDNDADDNLPLDLNCPGAGLCWQTKSHVFGDFQQIIADSNKYHKRLIRPTLRSLMSVPIRDPRIMLTSEDRPQKLLGILSFDSDHDLLSYFRSDKFLHQEVVKLANMIAESLTSWK